MKSRRKRNTEECSNAKMPRSGTFRQLSITESFKYSKPRKNIFKMKTPFLVSSACIEIDSDSDLETPPEFEFHGVRPKLEYDSETSNRSETMDAPSPPKRARTTIGVNKPATSTPKDKNVSPVTPQTARMESMYTSTPHELSPNRSTGSPDSIGSNSSDNTIVYSINSNRSNCWDETTALFSPSTSTKSVIKEVLIMNDPGDLEETALDAFPLHGINSNEVRPRTLEAGGSNSTTVKRLYFGSTTDNNNPTSKKEANVSKKNKITDSKNQDQRSTGTVSTTAIMKNSVAVKRLDFGSTTENNIATSRKEVKRKVPKKNKTTDSSNQDQKSISTVSATAIKRNSTAIKRLEFDCTTENNIATSKNEVKRRVPKKNKSTVSPNDDQKSAGTASTTDIKKTPAQKGRKRKVTTLSKNDDQRSNSTVKENSSPNKNSIAPSQESLIKLPVSTVALTAIPSRTPTHQISSFRHNSLDNNNHGAPPACLDMATPGGSGVNRSLSNGNLPVLSVEAIRKCPQNDDALTKQRRLDDVIDKLGTSKDLSVKVIAVDGTPPKTDQRSDSAMIVKNSTPTSLPSSTGWIVSASQVKTQNVTPSQPLEKSNQPQPIPNSVVNLSNISTATVSTGQNKNKISSKVIPVVSGKTPGKDTLTKEAVDQQQPCCSKSLVTENTTLNKTTSVHEGNAHPSKNSCTTPEKQTMKSTTPTPSPKKRSQRGSRSPGKDSPTKNREIKSLKSKEGKQLQVKQLDELVKLFRVVAKNRHLRSLLNKKEYDILKKFLNMEDNKKYVVMKLFVWKRLWYNIFNFCSKAFIEVNDDKDIIDIFEYLREERFVDTDYTTSTSLVELLKRLKDTQVTKIMAELKIKRLKTKEENIKKLLLVAGTQATLTCTKSFEDLIMERIEQKFGFAIKINDEVFNTFYNAYLLATFTNSDLDDVQVYFNNVIHLRVAFPESVVEDYPVFYSRDKFLSYGQALKMRKELEEQLINKKKTHKFLGIYNIGAEAYGQLYNLDSEDSVGEHKEAPHLERFSAQHVYCGILSTCCEHIYTKKNGYPSEVKKWLEYLIKKFPDSRRLGQWYRKLIWLHMHHLEDINYESAAKLLIHVLESKKNVLGEIAKYDLGTLGRPLKSSKKHKIDQMYHDRVAQVIPRAINIQKFPQRQIDSQCVRSEEPGKKRRYIDHRNEEVTVRGVEQVALRYYAENGYPGGAHCEGSLIMALLAIFFWDIIYHPERAIPGTFISAIQAAPLDISTSFFYQNRKDQINKRLKDIASEWSEERVIGFAAANWQEHSHESAAFGMVMNVIPDVMMVEVLITVIGRIVLAKIFERLIKNLRGFRSGMPDLLVWNIDEKKCKFVEVKGEGDRLSIGQKLWLQHLQEIGAPIEVCWVHSMGSKRKNIAKVPAESDKHQKEVEPPSRPDD